MESVEFNIITEDEYQCLSVEDKVAYINSAINQFKTRAAAYRVLGKGESTMRKWLKRKNYIFDKNLNAFVYSNEINDSDVLGECVSGDKHSNEDSMDSDMTIKCMADDKHSSEDSMDSDSVVNSTQKELMINTLYKDWDVLQAIIQDYKSKSMQSIVEVDTSVTVNDIPKSDKIARVSLRLNEVIWKEFNNYIFKNKKGISQKNMIEIALLQFIRDKK